MERVSEQWSKANARSQGRTDANLSNDSNHLGGIPADEYATKEYVQEYHDTKEGNLKDYVDRQDQSILNESKEYTNSQIRNQDFSDFAKLTDVQALDNKLSNEIEEGLATQKSYTDSKTQAIVDDVNANFQDVENSINTLNGNMNELFQSVSSGKGVVAEAITDKGVPTSASDSFNTMATNIRAIPTSSGGGGGEGGSGEDDPNYVNTGDATATSADILLGKTAYAKGQKLYGTLIAQAEEGYPTYGTDTSNATATEADIAYGKTAYARGQLLVGTMTANNEIEEIYGASGNPYTLSNAIFVSNDSPPDGASKITSRDCFKISQDGNYSVSIVREEETANIYVESLALGDNGFEYHASTNLEGQVEYKKYRYSLEELGITNYENLNWDNITYSIIDMALGVPGFGGDNKKCVLAILYQMSGNDIETDTSSTRYYIRLLTYHLSENAVIGKMYENESNTLEYTMPLPVSANNTTKRAYWGNFGICASNTKPNVFYISRREDDIYMTLGLSKIVIVPTGSGYSAIKTDGVHEVTSDYIHNGTLYIADDDRYAYINFNMTYLYFFRLLSDDNEEILSNPYRTNGYINSYSLVVSSFDKIISFDSNMSAEIYSIIFTDGGVSISKDKTITLNNASSGNVYTKYITRDNTKLIIVKGESYRSNNFQPYVYRNVCDYIYDLTEILSENDGATIDYLQKNFFGEELSTDSLEIQGNINDTKIIITVGNTYEKMFMIKNVIDTENLLGIKYKNQFFGRITAHVLTAGGPDVRAGKTYIGWQGYPETGIAEF